MISVPKVSIIIPTRNSEKIIPICMKGIKSQKYPKNKIEIIVVDNESTDGTAEIAKNSGAKFLILRGKPPLVCEQRNLGAKKAAGEWLIFLDHDMELSAGLLEDLARRANHNPEIRAWFIPEKIITGSNVLTEIRNFERQFYNKTSIDAVRIIKKTVFFKTEKQYDPILSGGPADWDLDIQLRHVGCKFKSINKPLYHHEERLNLVSYISKKRNWISGIEIYKNKWLKKYNGKYKYIVNQQLGLKYRILTVFFEDKKWKKVYKRPDLYLFTLCIKLAMLLLAITKK